MFAFLFMEFQSVLHWTIGFNVSTANKNKKKKKTTDDFEWEYNLV